MLRFDGIDASQADALFEALERTLNPTEILDEAVALLLSRIRRRFLQQIDPDGVPWQPSLASIIRQKTGRGGGTLFDSGTLFHSIQEYADTDTSRLIGTDVDYAKKHQEGIGQVKRVFIGANAEDQDLMLRLIIRRIEKVVK